MAVKRRLPENPLAEPPASKSIFERTDAAAQPTNFQESSNKNLDTRIKIQDSSSEPREKVNLRLPQNLNDWLDDLIKIGKRKHGRKIPKEIWVQTALEFFRSLPLPWEKISSPEDLQEHLKNLEKRIKNKGTRYPL